MSTMPEMATAEMDSDERRARLAHVVAHHVRQGWRVESQTDYQAIVAKGHKHSHGLHLFLTIITAGLWGLFVWLPLSIFGGEKRAVIDVDRYGNVNVSK